MWPSGQSTLAQCAVRRDALSGLGSNLSPGRIFELFLIIPAHMMKREIIILGRKRGFNGLLYKL